MQIDTSGVTAAYTNANKVTNEQNKAIQEKANVSKVEEIKKAIANGTYTVDTEKLSRKMLEELK